MRRRDALQLLGSAAAAAWVVPGWVVRLVDGFAHELGFRPDVVAPLIRPFLDAARL
jgi:hypothetical protein